jgi:hypothetical protein
MTDLTQQTPCEIDTKLAELHEKLGKAEHYLASDLKTVERMQARFDKTGFAPQLKDFQATVEKLEIEIAELQNEMFPYNAEFTRRGGWSRFFLVTNGNGHIHTSMYCDTCFPTTQFAWLPQYSGMTQEEIVERETYRCCTVCLPLAPAEQQAARERHTREQREAKAAERQAKKDEKLRKSAERAVKFMAKVEKQVTKSFGSWDVLWAEYSLYGKDGKKSLYAATADMPAQVGNYLYDEMDKRETEAAGRRFRESSRHFTDPKQIIAEAREKGLIN